MATLNQQLQELLTQPVEVSIPTDNTASVPAAQPEQPAPQEDANMPRPQRVELTNDDIYTSDNLMALGAKAGDIVENGELIRKYSTPDDARELGKRISFEDWITDAKYRQLNAEVGDRVMPDGTVRKAGAQKAWNNFVYGWTKAEGLINMSADVLEAASGISTLGDPLGESYGNEWKVGAISPTLRSWDTEAFNRNLELINLSEQRDLADRMGYEYMSELYRKKGDTGTAGIVGQIAGELGGGDVVIPAGALKQAPRIGLAAAGFGYGAGYSTASDVTEGKDVDLSKAYTMGLLGTAASQVFPALGSGIRAAGNAFNRRGAQAELNSVQKSFDELVADGASAETVAKEATRLNKRITNLEKITGNKINIPQTKTAAQKKLEDTIRNDSTFGRIVSKNLDKYLGVLSTRIRKYSEPLLGRVRKFEADSHLATHEKLNQVESWSTKMLSLPKATQRAIGFHLSNENFKAARGLMQSANPVLAREFDEFVIPTLKTLKEQLKAQGDTFDDIAEYFPRMVKDLQGLRAAMGTKAQSQLNEALNTIAANRGVNRHELSETEVNRVMERILRGYKPVVNKGKKIKYVKDRTVKLNPALYDFYQDPITALNDYIRKTVHDMETRKFFNASKVVDDQGLNVEASIGKLVQDEMKDLTINEQDELMGLLTARFTGGEQTPAAAARFIRNTGYMGTIANPLSALVQLGDLATSGALHGLTNTLGAMFGRSNPKFVKLKDLGLGNMISEELADPSRTSRLLRKAFKYSGFTAMDRFSKEVSMNAALKKNFNLAKSDAGTAALRKKWGKIFGTETDALVADLKAGNVTENVKLLAFNELSDMQPISLLEMPEKYLTSPNGRVLYMLKSFMIKQIDVARRNIVDEFKSNPAEAVKMAAALWGYLAIANGGTGVARDVLLGREVKAEDLPSRAMWALGGVYGIDKYTGERYLANGQIKDAAINMIMPATPIFDSVFSAIDSGIDVAAGRKEFEDVNFGKYVKPVPIFGNVVYNWFLGGAERWNEDAERKRND